MQTTVRWSRLLPCDITDTDGVLAALAATAAHGSARATETWLASALTHRGAGWLARATSTPVRVIRSPGRQLQHQPVCR
jgi:hypothetical protein